MSHAGGLVRSARSEGGGYFFFCLALRRSEGTT